MTDTTNLALPLIEGAQAQKHVTHNEALRILDTLVQLAVLDRDLNAPPASPSEGQRWIVKASPTPTGAWASHGNQIAAWQDSGWQFNSPNVGWLAYVVDEGVLLAWNGSAWANALSLLTTLQNIALLGIGTTADSANPLSAKLNNALYVAKTVAEGGNGDLRYKLSKESAAKTLSFLLQNNFSGRAEIGLLGDDDLHFKVSPDGSTFVDAVVLDRTTGTAKFNSQVHLTSNISPPQITADQHDYNPAGLSTGSVIRINSDAVRSLTGLQGGAAGRVVTLINTGVNVIALRGENAGSSGANRFATTFRLEPGFGVMLWYDATSSRWRMRGQANVKAWRQTIYDASGIHTFEPGVTEYELEAWGAGGSGGGGDTSTSQRGSGAGAGAFLRKRVTSNIDNSLTITVGVGGAGVIAAAGGAVGNDGGNTSVVGTNLGTLTAGGGQRGLSGVNAGGVGGTATNGDENIPGGAGTTSWSTSTLAAAFPGGFSPRGGDGGRTNVGAAGSVPGGGGACGNHTVGGVSGPGANGRVIVRWR